MGGLADFESVGRGDPAPAWVVRGIAEAWGLPDPAVTLIVLSENVTFRVAVAGAPRMVVRLGRPGYAADLAHSHSELVWIQALREAGIRTPEPIRGVDGELLQGLRSGTDDWTAAAFGWVEGRILEELPDFPRHLTEIGRLTARLHAQARSWRPPDGFARFGWEIPDLVGASARWGDWRAARLADVELRLLESAERLALTALADLVPTPADRGLIHADLRPSNAMLGPDGALTVIDFDDAGWGWYRYDFAAALTFYEHRPEAREMAAGWLAGYQETTPLRRAEVDEAAAWSMIRRLTMLGWQQTHRPDALPADLWAEYQPGTLEVAARYLADPRWLTG